MKTYAWIYQGVVQQLLLPYVGPDGNEVPITDRFTPEFLELAVDITDIVPQPQPTWTYDGSVFAAPVPWTPSPADILAANLAAQAALMTQASQAMTPIFMALQLGDATDTETVSAKAWRAYYQALQEVDLTVAEPAWPEAPTT